MADKGDLNMKNEEYLQDAIEIASRNRSTKVNAIKELRSSTGLKLFDATQLMNEAYKSINITIASDILASIENRPDKKAVAIKMIREQNDLSLTEAREAINEVYSNKKSPIVNSNSLKTTFEDIEEIHNTANVYDTTPSVQIKPIVSATLTGVRVSGSVKQPFTGVLKLSQLSDGSIYINSNSGILFRLLDYSWNGPLYNTVSKSKTVGTQKGKTKRKGRLLGAAVGTLVAGPVGLAIGAAHGTGNKKHSSDSQSNTFTTDTKVEAPAPATIQLENIETKEILVISYSCKSDQNSTMLSFRKIDNTQKVVNETIPTITSSIDPYEEVKKAKELLDMGIITQEEFDIKKKELLGL